MITNCSRDVINYSLIFGTQERVPKRIQATSVFNGLNIDTYAGGNGIVVAVRTIVLNFYNHNIAEKMFKMSYKSYQIWRPVNLKIESRLISL